MITIWATLKISFKKTAIEFDHSENYNGKTHQILLLYNYWEGQSKYWLLTKTNKQTRVHPSLAPSPLATSGKRPSMLTSNNIWYTTYGMCIHIHTRKVRASKTTIGIAKLERTKTRWKKKVWVLLLRGKRDRQTDKQSKKMQPTIHNTTLVCNVAQDNPGSLNMVNTLIAWGFVHGPPLKCMHLFLTPRSSVNSFYPIHAI